MSRPPPGRNARPVKSNAPRSPKPACPLRSKPKRSDETVMLKSERRDQKRERRVAKVRRASNRKALFVWQQATAKRLGLNPH